MAMIVTSARCIAVLLSIAGAVSPAIAAGAADTARERQEAVETPTGATSVRLYPESSTRFFVLDGPQELQFHTDASDAVTGGEFITPMTHVVLTRSIP